MTCYDLYRLKEENDRLRARVASLVEACQPFVRIKPIWGDACDDESMQGNVENLPTIGDLRRLAAMVGGGQPNG